nr:phytanoyl-CoA dioxygenase family protein [Gammaproteobacteria bacterium]
MLTLKQVNDYHEHGYGGPFPALSMAEVSRFREELEAFEASQGARLSVLPGQVRAKTHLLLPFMQELIRLKPVLDAVESLIGSNLLVYHLTCWLKEPGDGAFTSWHQDAAYFFLDPPEHVTAWIALSDATQESGCMRVIQGSHRGGAIQHGKGETKNNLLSNGQFVDWGETAQTQFLEVPAGHFSLHDTYLVHSSAPNKSSERRIGIGVSYIPTRVRCTHGKQLSATLVRGEDEYRHFQPEPPPLRAYDAEAVVTHADATRNFF